jgi:hypothetical protein
MGAATIVLTVDRCISKLGRKIIRKDDFDEIEANYAMELFNDRIKPMAEAQAKTSVDQLFEVYKDEKPDEIAKLAEDYLVAVYPSYGGADITCCGTVSVESKRSKLKELFKKRAKNVDELEVGLIESGPQPKYTAIN